jgi:predicted nucleic acid-binding Zn finger protein
MFRTSYVHHQEDYILHAAYMVCFPYICTSSQAGWSMCFLLKLVDCLHKRMENIPYKATCKL